jgi:hypothetical protein
MKPADSPSDDEFVHRMRRAVALPDAPPWLVRAAIDRWPAARPSALQSVAGAALRLVAAVLSFDSWTRPATALGMRATASETRHLLFSAQGRDIDLRISPAADHYALTGQILGPDEAGMVELATQPDATVEPADARVAALDSMGEFRLDGVRVGTYRLTLRLGRDEIVLPPIVVGARPG